MPFRINHQSSDDIRDAIDDLPEKTGVDLYN
jgi:hypothetical protein